LFSSALSNGSLASIVEDFRARAATSGLAQIEAPVCEHEGGWMKRNLRSICSPGEPEDDGTTAEFDSSHSWEPCTVAAAAAAAPCGAHTTDIWIPTLPPVSLNSMCEPIALHIQLQQHGKTKHSKNHRPAMVGSPAAGLRRHRRSTGNASVCIGSATAFRMDLDDDEQARESSLARGYDALGVELYSLEDGLEWQSQGSSSSMARLSDKGIKLSRNTSASSQGRVLFAGSLENSSLWPRSRMNLETAMSLDLADFHSLPTAGRSKKPMQQSSRTASMGAIRVTKSRQSLPTMSTSKSVGMLPALHSSKRGKSDAFAWNLSSKQRLGGVGGVY
jgi:hypothetical protein